MKTIKTYKKSIIYIVIKKDNLIHPVKEINSKIYSEMMMEKFKEKIMKIIVEIITMINIVSPINNPTAMRATLHRISFN